jgi:hypothetical protein
VVGCTTKVLYTAIGSADKFISDYVIRRSNAFFGRGKEGGVRTYAGTAGLRDYQNPTGAQSQPK